MIKKALLLTSALGIAVVMTACGEMEEDPAMENDPLMEEPVEVDPE